MTCFDDNTIIGQESYVVISFNQFADLNEKNASRKRLKGKSLLRKLTIILLDLTPVREHLDLLHYYQFGIYCCFAIEMKGQRSEYWELAFLWVH